MSSTVAPLSSASFESLLRELAQRYPTTLVGAQLEDIPRIAFNVGLVTERVGSDVSLCDLGGGIGLFSLGCAARGMRVTLVDDFNDSVNREFTSLPQILHRTLGVHVVNTDIVARPPEFAPGSLDVITTFDSIEHWHNSPRALLHRCLDWLKPGGLLVVGAPNCVNLRKRLTVPFGIGKWSPMSEWYEQTPFRGHVREPDVEDLRYIARDLELQDVEIVGRNWLGYRHRIGLVRVATRAVDILLRALPQICADIYLLGRKPLKPAAHSVG